MKLKEIQENSCDFIFEGGLFNTFSFVTYNEISYEIKFKPTDYNFIDKLDFPLFFF